MGGGQGRGPMPTASGALGFGRCRSTRAASTSIHPRQQALQTGGLCQTSTRSRGPRATTQTQPAQGQRKEHSRGINSSATSDATASAAALSLSPAARSEDELLSERRRTGQQRRTEAAASDRTNRDDAHKATKQTRRRHKSRTTKHAAIFLVAAQARQLGSSEGQYRHTSEMMGRGRQIQ